jgi:serpin B
VARAARRARRRRHLVPVALAVVVLAGACVGSSPSGQEVRGKAARRDPNKEFVGGTVAANNAFATDLYRAVAPNRGNFAYSPYAVLTALGMARAGTGNPSDTRSQFDSFLHANLSPDLDTGLSTLQQGLRARSGETRSTIRKGKVSLEFATSLWGQRGTHFKEDYLDLLSSAYDTGFHVVDFRTDAESARQAINKWGNEATKGRFDELAPRGDVTQYTRFVIAAESYLQAPWLLPFDPANTKRGVFQRVDDQPVDARMMQLTAPTGLRYADKPDWTAIEIPYLGEQLSLVVAMPTAGQFEAFEQGLNDDRVREIMTSLQPQPIDLRLPQFQFTTAANLDEAMKPVLPASFDQNADFSAITSDETLSMSEVLYKGFYGVDEEGTESTDATTARPTTGTQIAGVKTVTVDRPFVFFVRDRESGLVLLIGRVVNPG